MEKPRAQKVPLLCPYSSCRKIFTQTGNLKTHIRSHTNSRPFVCTFEDCQRSFITKSHLLAHISGHAEISSLYVSKAAEKHPHIEEEEKEKMRVAKKLKCLTCGLVFKKLRNLKKHSEIHRL
mmetsp:Transcript_1253/g.783  ORF Transcript_1253/g.783 Transcript_1253/m.783 type:complete len:122 (-) Transcript_1253:480-845(-)